MCGIAINTVVIVYTGRNASRPSVTRAEINTGRSALLRQLRENGTGCAAQIVLGEEREMLFGDVKSLAEAKFAPKKNGNDVARRRVLTEHSVAS